MYWFIDSEGVVVKYANNDGVEENAGELSTL